MVIDAIEVARRLRGETLNSLRSQSDPEPQFTSARDGERLAEIGAVLSIGTGKDCHDDTLPETVERLLQA
jgi:putative transposase